MHKQFSLPVVFVRKQVPRTIRVQPRWHSLWVPVGVGCHGGRQAPPVSQPASRWRRGASVPTKVLSQQQAGFSISRQKRCWAAIQCGHVSRAPGPMRSAGLARKAPLPACVLNCMPLADISQNPYLCSQFFRSFRDYKRMGLAEITSLSGRNSELTLQSRLPLPSLQHPCPPSNTPVLFGIDFASRPARGKPAHHLSYPGKRL